jgi:hypothetical protein
VVVAVAPHQQTFQLEAVTALLVVIPLLVVDYLLH